MLCLAKRPPPGKDLLAYHIRWRGGIKRFRERIIPGPGPLVPGAESVDHYSW